MKDDICKREEFADGPVIGDDDWLELSEALVLQRDGDDNHAIVRTNVPHLVAHHSPSGFEWGYAGSGPADLALNVCQWYLNRIHYQGMKSKCFDGTCFSMAFVLHQEFKRTFIACAPHEGIVIPFEQIQLWFNEHITDDLKRMYPAEVDEVTE